MFLFRDNLCLDNQRIVWSGLALIVRASRDLHDWKSLVDEQLAQLRNQ
jgi:hypothetical protein